MLVTSLKIKLVLICLFAICMPGIGFCGKIVYPFNAATAIVKAGESFTVWFNADPEQDVTSALLRAPSNTTSISSIRSQHGLWTYDTISGNTYNTRITIPVPEDTPANRYDIILNTSIGQAIAHRAVKVVKEFKPDYSIMHLSDTHLCQGPKINGLPERLYKLSALVDIANIIGAELIFLTGDLINNNMFPPQKRAEFFYQGSPEHELQGVHGFEAATFTAVGNHDFLEGTQPGEDFFAEKSQFWNQYHGLQYHHFHYGNTRCMVINDGWNGFDWTYQLNDHASWLDAVGSGNLRIAAYHKSEMGIMGAWAKEVDLGLALIGHNHHLAKDNPYELGGRPIQYYANSLREHFVFNLVRINSDGTYTIANNIDAVENPDDAPALWRPKLTMKYETPNNGTSPTNAATVANRFAISFPDARVRFFMPKGADYHVSKGRVEQAFDGDSAHVVDVRVSIDANSSTIVKIQPRKTR